ncbi:MAG: cellulose synthase [Streptosporangiaceae bacterium]|nr:cellulose synthase [Streptosporangiaceae bacterium]
MSTYDQIVGLPLCAGLTGLGLVLSYLVMRRRGLRSGLRGAAWSLLPLAAYLTGAVKMFWKIGVAIGDFATGFVLSTRVWSGIAVAGLAGVLFLVSGGLRRRRTRVKRGADADGVAGDAIAAAGRRATQPRATQPGGTQPGATQPGTLPALPGRATQPASTPRPAPAKLPVRRKPTADDLGDDDMRDVEEILRRRGIS